MLFHLNYLCHFFIDHIPDNHYYNTGLILPDICKKWVKQFRHPPLSSTSNAAHFQLKLGAAQHYKADKLFHGSDFFKSHLSIFTQAINNAGLNEKVQRKWFIAHIAFELMLDRMLVKNFPDKVDEFYQSLQAADKEELKFFLMHHGATDTDDFFQFYGHFTSIQYIYYYTNNNKFIYSLNRIMQRAGLHAIDENDANKLLNALLILENDYFADVALQLAGLKQLFTE